MLANIMSRSTYVWIYSEMCLKRVKFRENGHENAGWLRATDIIRFLSGQSIGGGCIAF